jgi:hypothetical protein
MASSPPKIVVDFLTSLAVQHWNVVLVWTSWSLRNYQTRQRCGPGKDNYLKFVSMLMGLIDSLTARIGEDSGTYSSSEKQEHEHEHEQEQEQE